MDFETFKKYVEENIKDFLPEQYEDATVSIQSVTKNNDAQLDGLIIKTADSNIAPSIYLNQFFELYQDGKNLEDIMYHIADVRVEHEMESGFDMRVLLDFEQMKDRIICKLVNAGMNAEYLSDKPHVVVDGELAICYHINLGDTPDGSGTMSTPVTNALMERYRISADELHEIAMKNTPEILPPKIADLRTILKGMAGIEDDLIDGLALGELATGAAMYVVTNEQNMNGAVNVFFPEVMDQIGEVLQSDQVYVLPSSIHEMIIIPDNGAMNYRELEAMVQEINGSMVAESEVLANHVMYLYPKEHKLIRCDVEEARQLSPEKEQTVKPKAAPKRNNMKSPKL